MTCCLILLQAQAKNSTLQVKIFHSHTVAFSCILPAIEIMNHDLMYPPGLPATLTPWPMQNN
jgi:hypothetical protein